MCFIDEIQKAVGGIRKPGSSCDVELAGPCTEAASTTDQIAAPAELAAAIEDAAKKLGRTQARVVNLKLERWCSVYGLHLQPAPFLRVEVADFRDVEPIAFALQRGEVRALGSAQVMGPSLLASMFNIGPPIARWHDVVALQAQGAMAMDQARFRIGSTKIQEDISAGRAQYPPDFGPPPMAQTRDLRPLPFGYGFGSGTTAKWLAKRAREVYDESTEEFEETKASLERGARRDLRPIMVL
ncbi:unnamed protein product [Symbiodinium natans]|uniref:Uncharacterized protein n=1 Tax=Symbiodinium natans TaxID=878477 RepID=A0A812PFY2_9DINO|nr:unnamed protein product [Symbiodinium natans]